ncbi:hypothetical protein RJ641_016577 [Dillenia turbinata]|uniref:Uncharacterized protein n=1 Tax=Dillenia turbinata TaxID=194707 RepID=A0AAN8UMA3_9MAGN
MGLESEEYTLPLFTKPLMQLQRSPEEEEPSGMRTPPLGHTTLSVPFRWEEEPGKPLPCTALTVSKPLVLDLPPSRLNATPGAITKSPSPTTVLEGPYRSSSFRILTKEKLGSFRKAGGNLVVVGKKGYFGNWGSSSKRSLKGSLVFSSSSSSCEESGEDSRRFLRVASSRSSSSSHFWATILESIKEVVPWRSKRSKPKA